MSLKWEGEKLKKKVESASMRGIDATMTAAVVYSKTKLFRSGASKAPPIEGKLTIRTEVLGGSIRVTQRAKAIRDGAAGIWGSVDVPYALTHEIGDPSRGIPPRPFLRPAAEAEYPKLGDRIKRALEGKSSFKTKAVTVTLPSGQVIEGEKLI